MGGYIAAVIKPPTQTPGWYKVKVKYSDADGTYRLSNTTMPQRVSDFVTYAVLPPIDSKPMPDSMFGVCEHYVSPDNMSVMAKAGIRWLRIDVMWSDIQPSKDTWNWDRMDDIVSTAKEYGIELLPMI
jgi:hypothetical protein